MSNQTKKILAIVILVGSIILAGYVGVWLLFIGGIVQIVEACKATPVNGLGIALGIFRFAFSAGIGWLIFYIGIGVSAFMWKSTKPKSASENFLRALGRR